MLADNMTIQMRQRRSRPAGRCAAILIALLALGHVVVGEERPNILMIVADDMGFSDVGCFGGEIRTPTIDTLAEVGARFSNFHVLPTCSPTRSVLLSGMDNHQAGLGTMGEFRPPETKGNPGYAGHLNFQVAALPEVLAANGYRTYMAGKWHLGGDEKTCPHARGFQETFALMQGGGSHWADRKPISPPETMVYRRNGKEVKSLPEDFYSTKYYTDRVLEWIERDGDQDEPFFAYLAYTAPHDPLHAPREFIDKYKGAYDDGWDALRQKRFQSLKELGIVGEEARCFPRLPTVKAWEAMTDEERALATRDMEVYAAMIDYLDGQVKRVIDHLKETGEYENTLILFFSDNGANGKTKESYPGQTEEFLSSFDNRRENRGLPGSYVEMGPGWAQASMAPCRLFKSFPSEGGIRSPLVVKMPGKTANAGQINHSFLHVRNIMPTILELAGIGHPGRGEFDGRQVKPMQGASILAMLQGKTDTPPKGVSEVGYELFGMKAYFADGWKILRLPKPYGSGEWQLYDLGKDPAELIDLGQQEPERLKTMVAGWERYQKQNGVIDLDFEAFLESGKAKD